MSIKKIGYLLSSFTLVITTGIGISKPAFAQTGAIFRTRPATINTTVGQSTGVQMEVNNVQNLGGYEFKLTFNPQVLQVRTTNGVSTAVGNSFLATTGRTVTALTPNIDNTNGSVSVAVYSFGGTSGGPSVGSTFQELASVSFDVVGSGTTNIQFATALLVQADLDGTLITSTQQGTTVNVAGPSPSASPVSNPTTMKIKFEGVIVGRGSQTVSIIFKQGTNTVYNQSLVFEPDAANDGVYNYVFPAGTIASGAYDIFIKGPVHLTTKVTGYNYASGTTTINFSGTPLLAGDVLTSDEVDIFDYNQLVTDFGSRYPGSSPGDLDLDDDIDIFDYSYLVGNFGKLGDQ